MSAARSARTWSIRTRTSRSASLRVDNSLGSVTAEAFCGGLIGYQRTYTEKDRAGKALYALLPGIAENRDNVPGAVTASTNPHTVTITSDAGQADRLTTASNNMTIRAYAYAGGIVGCGEPQSRMQVVSCLNAGGFDRPADGVFPDSRLKTGVNLAAYLRAQGHEDAAQALSDEPGADELRVSIVGGIVGVNGEKPCDRPLRQQGHDERSGRHGRRCRSERRSDHGLHAVRQHGQRNAGLYRRHRGSECRRQHGGHDRKLHGREKTAPSPDALRSAAS